MRRQLDDIALLASERNLTRSGRVGVVQGIGKPRVIAIPSALLVFMAPACIAGEQEAIRLVRSVVTREAGERRHVGTEAMRCLGQQPHRCSFVDSVRDALDDLADPTCVAGLRRH